VICWRVEWKTMEGWRVKGEERKEKKGVEKKDVKGKNACVWNKAKIGRGKRAILWSERGLAVGDWLKKSIGYMTWFSLVEGSFSQLNNQNKPMKTHCWLLLSRDRCPSPLLFPPPLLHSWAIALHTHCHCCDSTSHSTPISYHVLSCWLWERENVSHTSPILWIQFRFKFKGIYLYVNVHTFFSFNFVLFLI